MNTHTHTPTHPPPPPHTHLACSSRVLSFPETWKVYGWSSLVVCCTCMPSTPILQRTVKRCPTRLNLGVQHIRKLLNWGESYTPFSTKFLGLTVIHVRCLYKGVVFLHVFLTMKRCLSMADVFLAASLSRRPSLRNSFVGLTTSFSPTIS